METEVRRRSRHPWEEDKNQPAGYTTASDRRHAAGSPVPAISYHCSGTELQPQCNGRFLDSRCARSKELEKGCPEHRCPAEEWGGRAPRTAGTRRDGPTGGTTGA